MSEPTIRCLANEHGEYAHLLDVSRLGKARRCYCDPAVVVHSKRLLDIPLTQELVCSVCDARRLSLLQFWIVLDQKRTEPVAKEEEDVYDG